MRLSGEKIREIQKRGYESNQDPLENIKEILSIQLASLNEDMKLIGDEEIESKLNEVYDGETYAQYVEQLGINIQDAINLVRFGAEHQLAADQRVSAGMTKEQQEKEIKELALDMASYGYSSEAWGAANVKDKNKIAHRKLFLAEYLVKKGWRKAGDTISQDSIKAMKKAEAIQFGRIIPIDHDRKG